MSAFSCRRCNTAPPASDISGLCPSCVLVGILGEANRFDSEANPLAKPYASAPDARFESGDDLGPYRIERLIGRGGMGEVYEAVHADHGRRVALKVLARPIRRDADRARFLAEGQAAARISHPNSVFMLEAAEVAGLPIIAMELLPGDTLEDRVRRFGSLSSEQAVDATLQIIAGLDAAFTAGILHRDVKPGNCLIDRDGTIKVGDFGLSVSPDRPGAELIAAGATPAFASPEQLRGEPVSVRSDIYSVGATLWFLLTGEPPHDGKDLAELLTASERGAAPLPRTSDAPEGLRLVLEQVLAPRPADRPGSYAELRDALQPFSWAVRQDARQSRGVPGTVLDGVIALPAAAMVVAAFMGDRTTPSSLEAAMVALLLVGFFWARVNRVRSASRDELVARTTRLHGASAAARDYLSAGALIGGPILFGAALALMPRWFPNQPSRLPLTLLAIALSAMMAAQFLKRRSAPAGASRDHSRPLRGTSPASMPDLARRSDTSAAVRRSAASTSETRRLPRDAEDLAGPADTAALHSYGPFQTRTHLGATDVGELIEAWDPLLARRVWIHRVPPGTPRLTSAARHANRVTRLRWLQDHRGPDLAWDAFEAPNGTSLVWLENASAWWKVRVWLTDLAEELDARERSVESQPRLALDRVWITETGRGILLDFAVPLAAAVKKASVPADTASFFLHHSADYARERTGIPLPLSVSRLLQQLRGNQLTSGEAAKALRALASSPDTVTRHQRGLSLMMSAVVAGLSVFASARAWAVLQSASPAPYVPPGIPESVAGLADTAAAHAVAVHAASSLVPLSLGMLVCVVATAVVAVTYRGGFWLDALGITVVNQSGAPASRVQVLTRALAAWSWMPLQIIALSMGAPWWVIPVCAGLAAIEALRSPSRSLHDRLLGTVLVPR